MFLLSFYFATVAAVTMPDIPSVEVASVHDLIALPPKQAGKGRPVSIECVIYYCDTDGASCFAGSDGEFIFVRQPRQFLKPGTHVRIVGTTERGRTRNTLRASSVTILGTKRLDLPRYVDFADLVPGESECVWVRGEAEIYGAQINPSETIFYCRDQRCDFTVCYGKQMHRRQAAEYVGAIVGIEGNLALDPDRVEGVKLQLASPAGYLKIQLPPEAPLRIVASRNAHEIWRDKPATEFSIEGQITLVEGAGFFIEKDSAGTYVHNNERLKVRLGDIVMVSGVRTPVDGSLFARVIVWQTSRPLPVPPINKAATVVRDELESNRIRVRGKLVSHEYVGGRLVLSLLDDGVAYTAQALTGLPDIHRLDLDTATQLVLTGTSTFVATDKQFDVRVATLDDIVVTQRSGTITDSPLLISGLATMCLFCGTGGWWLMSQIRARRRDLRKLAAELSASYEAIRDGVLVLGEDQSVIHANRSVRGFFGLPVDAVVTAEQIADRLRSDDSSEFVHSWLQLPKSDETVDDVRLELKQPSPRVLSVYSAPVSLQPSKEILGRIWVFTDVTERDRLQSQLVHSQRQEAVGQLAGGFAHDFNNLLTGITASLDLAMLKDSTTVKDVKEYLEVASDAADRGADLVRQLLGFSKRTKLELKPCRVNDIVKQTFALVEPSLNSDVLLVHDPGENLPHVLVDETQIQQVLLNIGLNAVDAISGPGTIEVRTCSQTQNLDDGSTEDYVVIVISDTGQGMSADVMSKIYEPFFTSKKGKGTGLGLAMAEGIIQQHNGRIECESHEGVGTQFKILLPATSLPAHQSPTTAPGLSSLDGRHILIIDDEDIVRDALASLLRSFGARVATAADGKTGLSALSTSQFDVVMLDWKMPEMSGREVLKQIRKRQPKLPTIVCSGNISDCRDLDVDEDPDAVLQKPFGANRIASEINRVLQDSIE
ncbi:MAG: ATP-binding protein [Planctomycetaceae bacterium]